MIAALDDWNVVELAGGESGAQRKREKFAVNIRRIACGILVGEQRADRERAQARGNLTAATGGGGEGGSGGLGGGERLRGELIGAAFDDGFLKQAGG